MRIKIDDITKSTFRLPAPIDTREKQLRIGVKSIGFGFVSGEEEVKTAQILK